MSLHHFAPELRLGDIADIGGFRMQGAADEDYAGFNFGRADVNGDGLSDLIICADGYDGGGLLAGGAFVIYGKAAGINSSIDFANLARSDGFVIQGEFAYDLASRSIAGVGDVNGDGIEDMLIGAFKNDENGHDSGAAYIIYGRSEPFPSVIDLYDLPGDVGIKIVGETAEDYAGFWVAAAGDVDGDGRGDMIIGAPYNGAGAIQAGAAYVIFGRDSDFPGKIDLANMDAATGFKISGAAAFDSTGFGVASVGDINGDGMSDLIVGAPQTETGGTGLAYVIYGRSGIGAIDLSQLTATQGFVIRGEAGGDMAGFNVAGAGDVNGDGVADLLVGATMNDGGGTDAGATYVVFGRRDGFAGTLDLASLDGANGFKIEGARAGDQNGVCVSSAGDVNGDGYDDVLVGAWRSSVDGAGTGTAYLLFGKAAGFAPVVSLSVLTPRDAVRIVSEGDGDTTGRALSAAGDMNGDGYDDIAIGSPGNGEGGVEAGAAYVIYGRPDNHAPTGVDTRVAGVEDVDHVFALSDFGFVDSDSDALAAITIATLPTRGTLTLSDQNGASAVSIGQIVTADEIAAGRLYFVAEANASGIGYARFTVDVRDDGGIVGDGRDTATVASTVIIDVAADTSDAEGLVYGTAGDDTLVASGVHARLLGLSGNDLYVVSSKDHIVIEAIGEGDDTISTSVSYALAAGSEIETLEASNSAATIPLLLRGNEFDNIIRGNAGANGLVGGGGNNVLEGLDGDDTYLVETATDRVIETQGGGYDTVYAQIDYILTAGAQVEVLTAYDRTETVAQNLSGNEFDNLILGNNGNNIFVGGGGRDTMYGYRGDDVFYVNSLDDLPVELAGEGFDTIVTSVSYVMPQGMEFETLRTIDPTTTVAIDLTGNKIPNIIIGNAGNNVIDGLGGGDDMQGLGGDDIYVVRRTSDIVREEAGGGNDVVRTLANYTLAQGTSVETLAAYDPLDTTSLQLIGNALANTIIGNAGDNGLIGKGGSDILRGLGGADSYVVDGLATRVIEQVGDGYDTVYTTADYMLEAGSEIEALTVYDRSTKTAVTLTGNEFANLIYGNAGANRLVGGGGGDTLYGLSGNDSYVVDSADDRVVEAVGGGNDTVYTSISYALDPNAEVEFLRAIDSASTIGLRLSGNGFGNRIYGAAGDDSILGGTGVDTLYGLNGNDSYLVENTRTTVVEKKSGGYDTVYATVDYALAVGSHVEVLTVYDRALSNAIDLTGNELANTVYGNAGANRIDGGAGNDILYGLGGGDTFVFATASAVDNVDRIMNFASAVDRIELNHAVFAGIDPGLLDAGQFLVGTQARDADDRILYDPATGALFYDTDGIGGAAAVQFATLAPGTALAASDFFIG